MTAMKMMTAPMKAPRLIRWPLRVQPIPFPAVPPPAIALIRGVMTLSVKALTKVLKASATTRPTAMIIKSPCIKKFLKPFSISVPSRGVRLVTATAPYSPATARYRTNALVPAGLSAGGPEALGLDRGRIVAAGDQQIGGGLHEAGWATDEDGGLVVRRPGRGGDGGRADAAGGLACRRRPRVEIGEVEG